VVIGRRLARLGEETTRALGVAATIGRSFTFELLRAALQIDADQLIEHVEKAEKSGLLLSSIQYPDTRFEFSHEIVRKTVLSELSAARRPRFHLRIADAIEALFANSLEDHAHDLAHHLWNAGTAADPGRTLRFLAMAASRALQQSAYEAAIHYSQNAIQLLSRQRDTPERARQELDLQLCRGVALMALRGWSSSATGEAYARARQLCERLGDDPRLFSVLYGLTVFHMTRGEHPKALGVAEEMMRLALRLKNDEVLVEAYWALGSTQFFLGQLVEAHESLRRVVSLYDPVRHRTLAFLFAHDPYMSSLVLDAMTLWLLGFPEQGEANALAALSYARELGYPFSLCWCIQELTVYYVTRGDFPGAARLIEEGIPLMREHGYSMLEESEHALQLLATAAQGKMDEFIVKSRQARRYTDIEFQIRQTWVRATLAEAFGKAGKFSTATSLLDQASKLLQTNQERFFESEIYRIRGELVFDRAAGGPLSVSQAQEAEDFFRTAVASAREHCARMLELRSATSLSRLLAQTGRAAEASKVLTDTCAMFTEGFETPEFRAAKTLLATLPELRDSASKF
jgi:predicted ATPase